jgi:hypothetical protein
MGEAVPQLFQLVSMPSKLHHSNKPDQVLIGPPLLLAQEPAAREEQAGRCLVNHPPFTGISWRRSARRTAPSQSPSCSSRDRAKAKETSTARESAYSELKCEAKESTATKK